MERFDVPLHGNVGYAREYRVGGGGGGGGGVVGVMWLVVEA